MLADINYRITNRNTHALTEIFIDNKNHVALAARDQQEHSKDGQMANNTKLSNPKKICTRKVRDSFKTKKMNGISID